MGMRRKLLRKVVLPDQATSQKIPPFYRLWQWVTEKGGGGGEQRAESERDKRPFLIYLLAEGFPESANIWDRMELVAISGLQIHFVTTDLTLDMSQQGSSGPVWWDL